MKNIASLRRIRNLVLALFLVISIQFTVVRNVSASLCAPGQCCVNNFLDINLGGGSFLLVIFTSSGIIGIYDDGTGSGTVAICSLSGVCQTANF